MESTYIRIQKSKISCLLIIVFLFSYGCNSSTNSMEIVLTASEDNRRELKKVLQFYSKPEDSLKLRAAVFLIENMKSKYGYGQIKIGPRKELLNFVDSIYTSQVPVVANGKEFWYQKTKIRNKSNIVDSFWLSKKKESSPSKFKLSPVEKDVKTIKSKFLIENIEYAFLVREKPWNQHLTFDEFCEFILPYRNLHEPLEQWRKEAYLKYRNKINDSTSTALSAAHSIFDEVAIINENYVTFREFPDLGWNDLNKVLMGTCKDESTFVSYVMRSQGIPVFTIVQPFGTVYNCLYDSEGSYLQFNGSYRPNKNFNYYEDIRKAPSERMPKIYRESFKEDTRLLVELPLDQIPPFFRNPNILDMTSVLLDNAVIADFSDYKVEVESEIVFLCYFYNFGGLQYSAIDWSRVKNGMVEFEAIGSEKIYFLSTYENNEYTSISSPFYVNLDGTLDFLELNQKSKEKIRVFHKYPRNIVETDFARKLIGTSLEGANKKDFSDAERLYTISEIPDISKPIKIHSKKTFSYVRHVTDTTINLARLDFLDSENRILKGELICSSKDKSYHPESAFDQNIRTNYNNMDADSWIGLRFNEPVHLSSVNILYRNSFNTIEIGHQYEIYYWKDGKWISLERKVATNSFIDFEVPKNTLLLLKNLTKGEQIKPFFIRDGVQIWS